MKADLHSHTIYSDGIYSVYDLVVMAKEKKMDIIGITDHDNLDSYNAYLEVKDKLPIKVLIGVELSTWYMGENVHILGYFYNNCNPGMELITFLDDMKNKRIIRAKKMISNLKKYFDIEVDYDSIASKYKEIIARPHIAREISEKYNMSINDVFNKYLSNKSPAFVATSNTTVKEAIDLLHRNNAIAVWAHPVHNKNKFNDLDIINMGIDGLEANYPDNTNEDTKYYKDLCNKYNLLCTGGSDFHDHISHSEVGTSFIEDEDIDKLLSKLNIEK